MVSLTLESLTFTAFLLIRLLYLTGGNYEKEKKSDLLSILVKEMETQGMETEPPVSFDVKVLDGAAVVHLLPTTNITTFDEYANLCYFRHHSDCKRHQPLHVVL